jgi:hypothetical protein
VEESLNNSSSPKNGRLLGGNIILQIKWEDSVKDTTKLMEGVKNIETTSKFIHNQTYFWSVF